MNSYPLFLHTVFETSRPEALVRFHIVKSLPAVFKPDGPGCPRMRARRSPFLFARQGRAAARSTSPVQ